MITCVASVLQGLLCACASAATALVGADETPALPGSEPAGWEQWRGPSRDGRCHGPPWPEALSEERLVVRWRREGLGPSYATPIVAGSRVFTVGTLDEAREVVHALDRATGEELWSTSWEGAMKVPFFAAKNGSWIRSTPASDGEALYVAGMRDVLVCLDAASGELRWRVDFTERFGSALPDFGFVSSPLVVGEHLFVQAGASLVKLDKRSGETVWRTLDEGDGMHSPFSSPVLTQVAGREQLLVLSRTHMSGLDPRQGELLWSTPVEAFRGMNILTPQAWKDGVFTAAYGGRAQLLRLTAGEEGFAVDSAWTNRVQGYMTSPVLIDDHAYLFSRSNRFTCIDLESGEVRWISPPTGDDYWSLVFQGDRILALSDDGRLRLLRADPERYEVQAELELVEGSTWAHLAVAGRQLFVRELGALIVFDWS